jgi:TolB protein
VRYVVRLFCVFLVWISLPGYAALDLELTQGVQGAIPIAIVPLAGNATSSELIDIAAVINSDLQNSGRFKVLDRAQVTETPQSIDQVNAKTWQALGMDNLVVGTVRKLSDAKYQVNFQLLDVYGGKKGQGPANSQSSLLLTKEFIVPATGMRKLAHHISDLIYEKLTGERGVFATHIAYVVVEKLHNIPARYRLEVADIDGDDPRNVLVSKQPIMSPAWSPDGKKIAYVSFENGRAAIYVQDIATGHRRLVTDYPGINGAPAWSRDGTKLAFVLSKEGSPNIYTLDISTNNLVQRTVGNTIDTEPNWSPDGNSLLFTSNRSGGPQIYKVDLKTGSIQRVTYEGNYNASGSLTPDGKNMVMLHQQGGMYNIAIQNLQTGKLDVLTASGRDQSPSVAPNGSLVLYATRSGNRQVLGIVSTDGRVHLRLPARGGDVREPDWSPL